MKFSALVVSILFVLSHAEEEHDEAHTHAEHIFEEYDVDMDGFLSEGELQMSLKSLGLAHDAMYNEEDNEHDHESNATLVPCSPVHAFLEAFDLDHSENLNLTEFEAMLPLCAVFAMEGGCVETVAAGTAPHDEIHCKAPSTAVKWISGLIAAFVLVAVTWIGLIFFPLKQAEVFTSIIGLAAGTLIGDAILHLIPEALGVHSHGEGSDSETAYVAPALLILVGVLLMYVADRFFGHTHETAEKELSEQQENTDVEWSSSGVSELQESWDDDEASVALTESSAPPEISVSLVDDTPTPAVAASSAYTVLFGGAIHNLIDGILIGVAFSTDLGVGTATTVALLLHAVPHEVGDFAVLINAGFPRVKALLFNFLSSSVAIVGTIIGLAVGDGIEGSRDVILALAAGSFLYLGLSTMVPILRAEKNNVVGAFQVLMLVVGIVVMLLIALYGEPEQCGDDHGQEEASAPGTTGDAHNH